MTSEKTVFSLASELSDAFVSGKRNDGKEFIHLKNGSPQWMTDVIRAIHGDKLPDDTVYATIDQCATALSDASLDADPMGVIFEIEADAYTHDLTAWLHSRVDHVYYLTQALEEYSPEDGFQALAIAQKIQIDEIGATLVSELEALAE